MTPEYYIFLGIVLLGGIALGLIWQGCSWELYLLHKHKEKGAFCITGRFFYVVSESDFVRWNNRDLAEKSQANLGYEKDGIFWEGK